MNLPSLDAERRVPKRCPKPSRVQRVKDIETAEQRDARLLELWRKAVRSRDKLRCRCCTRPVVVTVELRANQAQCHHITGRGHKPARHDRRNGVLLCRLCHERVEANELLMVGTVFFTIDNRTYIDGDKQVLFREIG